MTIDRERLLIVVIASLLALIIISITCISVATINSNRMQKEQIACYQQAHDTQAIRACQGWS